MPVKAKNAGRNSTTTRSSSLSQQLARRCRESCGMIAPSRKAPNSAWMPIASVASAESSSATQHDRQHVAGSRRRCARACWTTPQQERAHEHEHDARCSRGSGRTVSRPPAARALTTLTTNASRHHAVTSSTAAQVSAITPRRVSGMPRSVRMRASTGNAVTDIDDAHEQREDGERHVAGRQARVEPAAPAPQPSTNGTTMLACEIATVAWVRLRSRRGVELQADQEHEQDHADLREDRQERRDAGGSRNADTAGRHAAEQRRAQQDAGRAPRR